VSRSLAVDYERIRVMGNFPCLRSSNFHFLQCLDTAGWMTKTCEIYTQKFSFETCRGRKPELGLPGKWSLRLRLWWYKMLIRRECMKAPAYMLPYLLTLVSGVWSLSTCNYTVSRLQLMFCWTSHLNRPPDMN